MKILVASKNRHKVEELRRSFAGIVGVELVGLDAFDEVDDVVENAHTYEGNALKKAREYRSAIGLPTLADDSGLAVDHLDGAPGVLSARYAGMHGDDAANNTRLLAEMQAVPESERRARFSCALAFVDDDVEHVSLGEVGGTILFAYRGTGGFGYDPLFLVDGTDETFAEMSPSTKSRVSHRAIASRGMREFLTRLVGGSDE